MNRRPELPESVEIEGAPPHHELRRKYLELCRKYETLVHRLEHESEERINLFTLSWWAWRTLSTGVALVDEKTVLLVNEPFRRLNQPSDGEQAWCDVDSRRKHYNLRQLVIDEAAPLHGRAPARKTLRATRGGRVIEIRLEAIISPIRHQQRVVGLVYEVTDQLRRDEELSAAQVKLVEQEHMREIGELTSGLAHDLNNLLSVMALRIEQLRLKPDSNAVEQLAKIVRDSSSMVVRIQEYAARGRSEVGTCDLGEVIRDSLALTEATLRQSSIDGVVYRVETEVGELPLVAGDPLDVRRVFTNLIINARDAMTGGGRLRIRATPRRSEVVVVVSDDGPGIPADILPHLFEPFVSSKGKGGSGLGLAMARRAMQQLGGKIEAANRPEGGAMFTLVFPVAG